MIAELPDMLPKYAGHLNDDFSYRFFKYKKVSEGKIRIGSYDGYEFRFTAPCESRQGLYGEGYLGTLLAAARYGSTEGRHSIYARHSAGSDVHGPEDVGEKGELPIILNSFTFGL